jgi:hypothetical protein
MWHGRILILAGAIAILAAGTASAQTVTDARVWTSLTVQGRPAAGPWRWTMETILRTREGVSDIDTLVLRPAVGYAIGARTTISAGYAHSAAFLAAGGVSNEHRIFQQLLWQRSGAWTIGLRTRFEQRFLEGNSGTSLRARQQIRISRPLASASRWTVVGWDEVSVHLNTTARFTQGVDQNRAFAGLGRTLSRQARIEVGYLNQFVVGGDPNRVNHVLFCGVNAAVQ